MVRAVPSTGQATPKLKYEVMVRAVTRLRREREEPAATLAGETAIVTLLARIFQVMLGLGLLLVVAGSLLEIAGDGQLPEQTVPASEVPRLLLEGDGDALLTLGILVFLAGPVLGVLALAISYFRSGDRRSGVLALLVLVIVGSVPLIRLLRGG
uniref:DUF1634 domain-containing protein n=2 Tax=Thermorudis TaxID=1649508 RepID=A0A831TB65_9BACT